MPWGRKGGQSKGGLRGAGQGWSQGGVSQGGVRRKRQQQNNQVFSTVAGLEELEQLQSEFESFLGVVDQDIEVKSEYWSALKKGEAGQRDRTPRKEAGDLCFDPKFHVASVQQENFQVPESLCGVSEEDL